MCRIAYVQQSDIEPKFCDICRTTPKSYIREHPEILESTDGLGNLNFMGKQDAKVWLNNKLKATNYCEEHDKYLCNKCKNLCGKEIEIDEDSI